MNEFKLLNTGSKKDPLTNRVTITESIQYKIGISIALCIFLGIITLDYLNFELPGWAEFLLSAGIVIGYFVAFMAYFFSRDEGKVMMSKTEIDVQPNKEAEHYPSNSIKLNDAEAINVNIIQSFQFIITRIILYVNIVEDGTEKGFGLLLSSKNDYEQYLEVLDSWYRTGYNLHETDQLGNRIFKLNRGINYADVQQIKNEYGIEW